MRLEPDSDLYWTNLGWAQYLLGLLEQSEESSLRATLLAPQRYRQLQPGPGPQRDRAAGKRDRGLRCCAAARSAVEDAAIEDLGDALRRYPREPAVHYSLAYLLEAAGQRSAALEQYRTYLNRAGAEAPLAARAESRTVSLAPASRAAAARRHQAVPRQRAGHGRQPAGRGSAAAQLRVYTPGSAAEPAGHHAGTASGPG